MPPAGTTSLRGPLSRTLLLLQGSSHVTGPPQGLVSATAAPTTQRQAVRPQIQTLPCHGGWDWALHTRLPWGGVGGRSEYFDSNSEETGADSHVGGPLTRKRTQEEGWLGLPFLCSEGKNSDRQMGNGLNHCTSIGWGGVQTSGTQIPLPLPSLKHEPSFTSWLQGGLLASLIPTHSAPTATVLQRPRRP